MKCPRETAAAARLEALAIARSKARDERGEVVSQTVARFAAAIVRARQAERYARRGRCAAARGRINNGYGFLRAAARATKTRLRRRLIPDRRPTGAR